MRKIFFAVFLFAGISGLFAQTWVHQNVPFCGRLGAIGASGTNLLAGWDRNMLYSSDSGDHWSGLELTQNYSIFEICAMGADTVYALDDARIYQSTDNGKNWNRLGAITVLDKITFTNNYIFAIKNNNIVIGSRDGLTWALAADSGLSDSVLTTVAAYEDRLFAGTESSGVFVSDDNAASWTRCSDNLPVDSAGVYPSITSLYVANGRLFMVCDSGVFASSCVDSIDWEKIDNGIVDSAVYAIFSNENTLFAGTDKGVYRSVDDGVSWALSDSGLPVDKSTGNQSVYGFTAIGSKIYASTLHGVYMSIDSGVSWIPKNSHTAVTSFTAMGGYLCAGTQNGILRSSDNGETWSLPDSSPLYVNALASNSVSLYAGTGVGGWQTGAVYYSTDSGGSWTISSSSSTFSQKVGSIAVNGSYILAGMPGYVGVKRSAGYGNSWANANTGLIFSETSNYNVYVTFLASYGTIFFVTTRNGFFRTENDGDNWYASDTGISDTVCSFCACGDYLLTSTKVGVFRSKDGGFNWSRVFSSREVRNIVSVGSYVFAGTDSGVYYSANYGSNWQMVSEGLDNLDITVLTVKGEYLFAASSMGSIYRLLLSDVVAVSKPVLSRKTAGFPEVTFVKKNSTVTGISLSLEYPQTVALAIYDISGKRITTFSSRNYSAGVHFIGLNTGNLSRGYYVAGVETVHGVKYCGLLQIK